MSLQLNTHKKQLASVRLDLFVDYMLIDEHPFDVTPIILYLLWNHNQIWSKQNFGAPTTIKRYNADQIQWKQQQQRNKSVWLKFEA